MGWGALCVACSFGLMSFMIFWVSSLGAQTGVYQQLKQPGYGPGNGSRQQSKVNRPTDHFADCYIRS